MDANFIANQCESAVSERLKHFNDSTIKNFTPSIVNGRRYIGFIKDGKEFLVEILVTEA